MENKSNKKESKRMTAKGLIEKGKKQGSLTLGEIMEAFSETELDKDQVENLISLNEELDSDLVKLNLKKSNEELKAQEINQSIKDEKLKLKKYKQDLLDLENKIKEQQPEIARKKE